jgi:hypothetical protein
MQPSAHRFEDIAVLAPQHAPVLAAIRMLVKDVHPDAVETVRLGDRAVAWGWGPAKMKEGYVYALPYSSHVNLGFYQGADLPDPEHQMEGAGKNLRHIKIRAREDLDAPAIRQLIEAARDKRRAALTSKGA